MELTQEQRTDIIILLEREVEKLQESTRAYEQLETSDYEKGDLLNWYKRMLVKYKSILSVLKGQNNGKNTQLLG